jgi:hypothetical protein
MPLITLETNHSGAFDSPDYLCPWGCTRDNYTSFFCCKLKENEN